MHDTFKTSYPAKVLTDSEGEPVLRKNGEPFYVACPKLDLGSQQLAMQSGDVVGVHGTIDYVTGTRNLVFMLRKRTRDEVQGELFNQPTNG